MVKVAIVDDEDVFDEFFKNRVEQFFEKCDIECTVATFSSAKECLSKEREFDLYFLDIDLNGQDGMNLASQIRKIYGKKTEIIFVTSVESAVFDAFTVDALGFIRKSFLDIDFDKSMKRFIDRWQEKDLKLEFRTDSGIVGIGVEEIIMAEVYGHQMTLYCTNKTVTVRQKLENLLEYVRNRSFVQPHRGYLVNCNYIDKITNDVVILENGKHVPLSRRNQKEVRKVFLEYISHIAER